MKPIEINKKYKEEKKKKKITCKSLDWKQKLTIKEHNRLRKNLVAKADRVFAEFIRTRDRKKSCISFWAENCKNKIQNCCHRIPRERYSHRWSETNCYWGCASCNGFNKQEHQQIFTRNMISKFWIERVDEQYMTRSKKKPTLDELKTIINNFQDKLKSLTSKTLK